VDPAEAMAMMREAARQGSERLFRRALRKMNWTGRPAEEFIEGVRLAWLSGEPYGARRIASLGHEAYPDDDTLRRMAILTGPARVIGTSPASNPEGILADMEWFKSHAREHLDKWVAVRDGVLLGEADSWEELERLVPDLRQAIVDRIG